jgi:hypothetical protein
MVWVVDGTRRKLDFPRFLKGKRNSFENTVFYNTDNPKLFRVDHIDWCLPPAWLESSVPVIFDFRGDGSMDDSEGLRVTLYCLFPQAGRYARVAEISRKAFINATTNGEWTLRVQKFISDSRKQDEIEAKEQQQAMTSTSNKVTYTWRGIPLIGGSKEYQKRSLKSNKPFRKRRR